MIWFLYVPCLFDYEVFHIILIRGWKIYLVLTRVKAPLGVLLLHSILSRALGSAELSALTHIIVCGWGCLVLVKDELSFVGEFTVGFQFAIGQAEGALA